jgi:hypothetical protein
VNKKTVEKSPGSAWIMMKMFAIGSYHLGNRDVTARRYGIETAKVAIRLTGNRQRKVRAPNNFFFFQKMEKNVVGSA